MKALKSDFARQVLKDPASAQLLRQAVRQAGYGPDHGVCVTVHPVRDDGVRGHAVAVNVHFVPKAG